MEVLLIKSADRLFEILQQTRDAWVETSANPSALEQLERIRSSLKEPNAIPGCLELLELTYRYSLNSDTAGIAAPLHESLYNAVVRGSVSFFVFLSNNGHDPEELQRLLAELVPDPEIRRAFMAKIPTTVSLVHEASVQLGYLHRRTDALRELNDLLRAKRDELPISNPDAFERFLETIEKLIQLGELVPNDQ